MAMPPEESILVIRLTAMGDVVLTLPAVHVLRENFPAARISYLTSLENAPLLQGFRNVDEVFALDRAVFRSGRPWRMAGEVARLVRRVRAAKFSLAVDLHGNGESAWLTRLTGARRRWGIVRKASRRRAYTEWTGNVPLHPAEANCALLGRGGLKIGRWRNDFFLPPEALATAREFFIARGLAPERPTLYVQPFTSGAHKNWALENYLAVARHWRAAGVQVLFGGGPADSGALEPARREGFAVSAGVPLLVTGGLLQLSTLVIGGDTGALHLAVALGKRVLMLMHRIDPGSAVPFSHPEWSLNAPGNRPLAELATSAVIDSSAAAFREVCG